MDVSIQPLQMLFKANFTCTERGRQTNLHYKIREAQQERKLEGPFS